MASSFIGSLSVSAVREQMSTMRGCCGRAGSGVTGPACISELLHVLLGVWQVHQPYSRTLGWVFGTSRGNTVAEKSYDLVESLSIN